MTALFITFEGLDGSGKSTHLRRAAEWMQARGLDVRTTHEPGGTPLSDAIRGLFLDPCWEQVDPRVEALLVFASRRQHLAEVIEPSLTADTYILCDRFTDSSLAYQGAGRGLSREWLTALDQLATDGRQPDATLLFDLPAEAAQLRGQSLTRRQSEGGLDRFDVETLEFYSRVREGFLELAEASPDRFRVIDSSQDVETTWDQVQRVLGEILDATES